MIHLDEIKAISDPMERYTFANAAFNVERDLASVRVRELLEAHGLSQHFVCTSIGVDPGGFHRHLKKSFTMQPHALTHLCYSFLNMSAHETLLGIRAEVPLPRDLSFLVSIMMEPAKIPYAEKLHTELQEVYSHAKANQELFTAKSTESECHDLIRSRIIEYARDHFIVPHSICGERMHMSLRLAIKALMEENTNALAAINTLLYIAVETNMPLDYFISPIYANLCDLRLHESQPGDIIKDKKILLFIVKFLQLRPALQKEFLTHAMQEYWNYPD